jgi:zinc-ribbon domain
MYCPNCASENPAESKFCRQCGMGLANVAEAIRQEAGDRGLQPQVSPWIKDFYSGRQQMWEGAIRTGAGLLLLGLDLVLAFAGQRGGAFWVSLLVLMGLLGKGVHQFNKGWTAWSRAGVELRAFGHDSPPAGKRPLSDTASYAPTQVAVNSSDLINPRA